MRVESIRWLSASADEAEVLVSDGQFRCEAYSQPCSASVGDLISEPLHLFGVRSAVLNAAGIERIEKITPDGLAHRLTARVECLQEGRLSVGAIELMAEDRLPGGIQDGDLVDIECARVDLW